MTPNEQIREALTGGRGEVRQKCETCGGNWEEMRFYEHVPQPEDEHDFSGHCPDCTNGWVYDEKRLADAVMSFQFEGKPFIGNGRSESHRFSIALDQWSIRYKNRWQATLEAYVLGEVCDCKNLDIEILGITVKCDPSICGGCNGTGRDPKTAWTEDAPDYDSESGMVLLKDMCQKQSVYLGIEILHMGVNAVARGDALGGEGKAWADTEWTALYQAVLAAIAGIGAKETI